MFYVHRHLYVCKFRVGCCACSVVLCWANKTGRKSAPARVYACKVRAGCWTCSVVLCWDNRHKNTAIHCRKKKCPYWGQQFRRTMCGMKGEFRRPSLMKKSSGGRLKGNNNYFPEKRPTAIKELNGPRKQRPTAPKDDKQPALLHSYKQVETRQQWYYWLFHTYNPRYLFCIQALVTP